MHSLDKTSKKNFPWIIILATIAAVGLVVLFQDPLSYLREILAKDNLIAVFTYQDSTEEDFQCEILTAGMRELIEEE